MSRRKIKVKQFWAYLAVIFAAAVAGLSPWFTPLFEAKLISDYFQPALNGVATLFAVIVAFIVYIFWRKSAQWKKKRLLICGLIAIVACTFACLVLSNTVGVVWAPGVAMTIAVRLFW